jgi:hypothetical protein
MARREPRPTFRALFREAHSPLFYFVKREIIFLAGNFFTFLFTASGRLLVFVSCDPENLHEKN